MNKLQKAGLVRTVHAICGKKGLGLTDDERRAIQLAVTGLASISDMTLPQLDDLVRHLRKIQNASKAVGGAKDEWRFVFSLVPERQALGRKIYRLAERIGAMQTPPVAVISKAYVEGVTQQMRGTEQPLEFCDPAQLRKVVQALEVYLKRHGG